MTMHCPVEHVSHIFIIVMFATLTATSAQQQEQRQSPALDKNTLFMDFFPLSKENFTEKVEVSEKIWFVVFHKGILEVALKREVALLRGVVRFAMVDRRLQTDLVRSLELDSEAVVARVYFSDWEASSSTPPSGDERQHKDFTRLKDAIYFAKTRVANSFPELEVDKIKDLFITAFESIPSRFPGILVLESDPLSYRNLALRAAAWQMRNYFYFYRVSNADDPAVRASKLSAVVDDGENITCPGLFIVATNISENAAQSADVGNEDLESMVQFQTIRYKPSTLGAISYSSLMGFLVTINQQLRPTLLGQTFAQDVDVLNARDVLALEADLFDVRLLENGINSVPTDSTDDRMVKDEL